MPYRRQQPQGQQNGNMMIGGGESSYVSAEHMKEVDVPTETVLGAVNGALSGAIVSSVVSAVVTAGKHDGHGILRQAIKDIGSKHLIGVLAGTTALGALGGYVRHSRAVKHNEWSQNHYAHLERAEGAVNDNPFRHADQVAERREAAEQEHGRS